MAVIRSYVCKPDRELYYMDTTEQDIAEFYSGKMPEKIQQYEEAYGTYDCPGLFYIKNEEQELKVLGIEYRPNDDDVEYPAHLNHVWLPMCVMTKDAISEDVRLSDETIWDIIGIGEKRIENNPFAAGKLEFTPTDSVVQVYNQKGISRILTTSEYSAAIPILSISELESEKEKELFKVAYRDAITGHNNWNYLWPIISAFELAGVQDYAFVHFDIKDFKAINVVFGHEVANQVLINVTQQMNRCDWVYYSARCDNDNFAMMIKGMPEEETRAKLQEFFASISHPVGHEDYTIHYRCGVVPMKSTMMIGNRVADAGKQAQAAGVKPFETEIIFFTDEMRDQQEWAIRVRAYLDTAIKKDEFLIYLQPKFDIRTNTIHGAEALIRWLYKGERFLSPGLFIPIFETGSMIGKVDDVVLNKVCATIKRWKEEGRKLYPVSVNVSRMSMGIPDLVEHLTDIVDSYGVDHSLIDFELTESASFDNKEGMIQVIRELKERGFKTSMDDFGTGYSSLSSLSEMQFDTLKIDKSFVDGIGRNKECHKNCAVVKHIISMAQELELICLAEGAEEQEQAELLKEFGCDVIQGFYYSRPLPVAEFEKNYLS